MKSIAPMVLCAALSLACARASAQAPAPSTGFRAGFLCQLADAEKKVISLAEAFPGDLCR